MPTIKFRQELVCKREDICQRRFIPFSIVKSEVGVSGVVYKLSDGFWQLQQDLVSEAAGKNFIYDSIKREIDQNNKKIDGINIQNQKLLKFMTELE